MSKPFTGTVMERTEVPIENHCAWDTVPIPDGVVTHSEPGPAVRELEQRRQDG